MRGIDEIMVDKRVRACRIVEHLCLRTYRQVPAVVAKVSSTSRPVDASKMMSLKGRLSIAECPYILQLSP